MQNLRLIVDALKNATKTKEAAFGRLHQRANQLQNENHELRVPKNAIEDQVDQAKQAIHRLGTQVIELCNTFHERKKTIHDMCVEGNQHREQIQEEAAHLKDQQLFVMQRRINRVSKHCLQTIAELQEHLESQKRRQSSTMHPNWSQYLKKVHSSNSLLCNNLSTPCSVKLKSTYDEHLANLRG
ncbi:hypothetical protein KP509_09G031800 [Ceratopteris richardii]|uniref:Uncharacterized protein n=1 Tax=Ceratopteris richardii TaxID=49495 RepID=A0A8T2U9B7_CERRI|nr:hypothetical protein KP509_09G031800 [Ceratopteris richardii]